MYHPSFLQKNSEKEARLLLPSDLWGVDRWGKVGGGGLGGEPTNKDRKVSNFFVARVKVVWKKDWNKKYQKTVTLALQ